MTDSDIWYPGERELQRSAVARLMRALGVESYDALLAFPVHDPARYWDVVLRFCDIVWDVAPQGYIDTARGAPFPDWFPGGRLNWVKSVFAWGGRPPSASAIAVTGEREDGSVVSVTYASLEQRVRELATGLARTGVQRGDRVGLLMQNGVEATLTLLALSAMGAVCVPLFSGFGADPVVARLASAGASTLVASSGFQRRGRRMNVEAVAREAWSRLPLVQRVVWLGATEGAQTPGCEFDWQTIARGAQGDLHPVVPMSPDDPFMVVFTSGTTGKPKGVVHTHGGFPLKIAHDAVVHFDVDPGDVFSFPADMGWIAGPIMLSCALMRGATLVCYDGTPDFPDWSRMSRLVERHRITHFGSAPTLIRGMANHADVSMAGDVSSLRVLITAGEGIDPEHFVWFQRHFGRGTQPVINYTGGTEVSGALLGSVVVRPIPPAAFNSTSPGVDVDITDGTGQSLTGVVGELVVRRPFVGMTRSFWQDDTRYLETYWQTIPGLWVHGDLALRRHDGNIFMRGRSDDTLKVAGKRLGPAEVEEVVLQVPDVAEAAAIGVDDADKGQRLVVFVVTRGGEDARAVASQVQSRVADKLGRAFRPATVHVVPQLPKTRSSKIMRRAIRSAYCGLPAGDLSSLDNPAALDAIRALRQAE